MLMKLLLLAATLCCALASVAQDASPKNFPEYTADARLKFPAHYREWIYLSSGIDMNYNPGANAMEHSMFDNVFVNPEAYKSFLDTGTWPDKTMLMLEIRGAQNKGSINKSGHYQGSDVMGLEIHIKDEARFPGKWAFFSFEDEVSGRLVPSGAACYTCHQQHAAVDTTFVQFYPTLLEIAKKKNTLSEAYTSETAASK
jgi:hypothetical protein